MSCWIKYEENIIQFHIKKLPHFAPKWELANLLVPSNINPSFTPPFHCLVSYIINIPVSVHALWERLGVLAPRSSMTLARFFFVFTACGLQGSVVVRVRTLILWCDGSNSSRANGHILPSTCIISPKKDPLVYRNCGENISFLLFFPVSMFKSSLGTRGSCLGDRNSSFSWLHFPSSTEAGLAYWVTIQPFYS